jgi:hypothetical protein
MIYENTEKKYLQHYPVHQLTSAVVLRGRGIQGVGSL